MGIYRTGFRAWVFRGATSYLDVTKFYYGNCVFQVMYRPCTDCEHPSVPLKVRQVETLSFVSWDVPHTGPSIHPHPPYSYYIPYSI